MSKIAPALTSSPRTHQSQMRTLAFLLSGSLALGLTSAHAIPPAPLPYNFGGRDTLHYDRLTLSLFADDGGSHNLNITRDHSPTYGDRSLKGADGRPLLPVTQLELPHFVESNRKPPSLAADEGSSHWIPYDCVHRNRLPISYSSDLDAADAGSSGG
jgi:hypothetical protein